MYSYFAVVYIGFGLSVFEILKDIEVRKYVKVSWFINVAKFNISWNYISFVWVFLSELKITLEHYMYQLEPNNL